MGVHWSPPCPHSKPRCFLQTCLSITGKHLEMGLQGQQGGHWPGLHSHMVPEHRMRREPWELQDLAQKPKKGE